MGGLLPCNAVKDIYFTGKMQLKKLDEQSSVQETLINFNIFCLIRVTVVVHNIRVKTEKLFTILFAVLS
jgi:hypothetical protein